MSKALLSRVEALERAQGLGQELLLVIHDSRPQHEFARIAGYTCTVNGERFEVRRKDKETEKTLLNRVEAQIKQRAPSATFAHGNPIYERVV